MPGRSKDPKPSRITVRLAEGDYQALQDEAERSGMTVGAIVRQAVRRWLHRNPDRPRKRVLPPKRRERERAFNRASMHDRITVRLTDDDRAALSAEARRRGATIGTVVRGLLASDLSIS